MKTQPVPNVNAQANQSAFRNSEIHMVGRYAYIPWGTLVMIEAICANYQDDIPPTHIFGDVQW